MKLLFNIFIGVVLSTTTFAQTFHFVSMFDTKDESIGVGMQKERQLINNEIQTIAGYLEEFGYSSEFSDYYGETCGKAPLMRAINSLQVAPEDIVMFYYGGHGGRAMNNSSDRFPQMCLGENSERNYVPSTLIKNMVLKKQPRLTIILTGCCNSEANWITIKNVVAMSKGYTSQNGVNKDAYKRLFIDARGVVQMTSSQAGEYSWTTDAGSFFALDLITKLDNVGKNALEADWNVLCNSIKNTISAYDIRTKEGLTKQHPDFDVSVVYTNESNNGNTDNKGRTTTKKVVNDVEYDLSQDLAKLLDKSVDRNTRLMLVPAILSKHFAAGAKVLTLGRDMSTVVDYEDAEVFLRRIAMSPYISQINVVEQESGKNRVVRVHEVRTR